MSGDGGYVITPAGRETLRHGPRGVPHACWNPVGQPARLLEGPA